MSPHVVITRDCTITLRLQDLEAVCTDCLGLRTDHGSQSNPSTVGFCNTSSPRLYCERSPPRGGSPDSHMIGRVQANFTYTGLGKVFLL